jgi:hypothetical protein
MLVALNNWNVALPKKTAIGLLAAYMALVALRVVVPYFIAEESRYWLDFATSLLRLLGVLALWTSVPLFLNARWVNTVIHWSPLAFFTHSGHFPLIALLNYFVLAKLLPHSNDAFLLLHFFLTVASTLVILFVGASILRRFAPGLFRILSGSRQWPEESGQPVTTIDGVLLQRGREG